MHQHCVLILDEQKCATAYKSRDLQRLVTFKVIGEAIITVLRCYWTAVGDGKETKKKKLEGWRGQVDERVLWVEVLGV